MKQYSSDPRLRDVLKNDIQQIHFIRKLRQDIHEIMNFYLSPQQKEELNSMGIVKRTLWIVWWVLKSLLLKLTPMRRLMFVIALFLSFSIEVHTDHSTKIINDFSLTTLIFVLIILLELKDKLLARDELETGRKVQMTLMPTSKPLVPGWDIYLTTLPANDVGGDLVDYLRVQGSKHFISIADVAGKGLRAALLTSKLQATLRALVAHCSDLPLLIKNVNDIFYRDRVPSSFASLMTLCIEEHSSSLHYVNAGHLPPYLVTSHGCTELPKGGVALGLSPDAQYDQQTLNLNSGEFLFVYSDGIPDAQNERGEFFGADRLKNLLVHHAHLPAEQLAQNLIAALKNFAGYAPATDDISFIILKKF